MWTLESWRQSWLLLLALLCSFMWWSTRAHAAFIPQSSLTELTWLVEAATPRQDQVQVHPFLERWWKVTQSSRTTLSAEKLSECHRESDLQAPRQNALCNWSTSMPLVFWGKPPVWWSEGTDEVRSIFPDSSLLPQVGEVVISEVQWAGSRSSATAPSQDEWMELTNTTEKTFNLKGIKIGVALTAGRTAIVSADLWLGPYGTVVLGASQEPFTHLRFPLDWWHASFVVPNTESRLSLLLPTGELLDSVASGVWKAGANSSTGYRASAQRRWPLGTGQDWAQWTQCPEEPESWCHPSKQFSWKPGEYTTYSTPWQAGYWD